MRFKNSVFFGLFIFLSHSSYAQNSSNIMVAYNDVRGKDKIALTDLAIKDVFLIHGKDVFPSTLSEKLNYEKIDKKLIEYIPDRNSSGHLVLDWEAEWIKVLNGQKKVSKSRFERVLTEYINLIRYVKKERPNIKVSYYGIPFRASVVQGNKLYLANKKVSKLIQELDFLCPSLYFFKRSPERASALASNKKYVYDNMEVFKLLKKDFNKQILVFIWNRWHPNSNYNKQELMNIEDFKVLVGEIKKELSVEDGMILYLNDYTVQRFKSQVHQNDLRNSGVMSKGLPEHYQTSTMKKYLEVIR